MRNSIPANLAHFAKEVEAIFEMVPGLSYMNIYYGSEMEITKDGSVAGKWIQVPKLLVHVPPEFDFNSIKDPIIAHLKDVVIETGVLKIKKLSMNPFNEDSTYMATSRAIHQALYGKTLWRGNVLVSFRMYLSPEIIRMEPRLDPAY